MDNQLSCQLAVSGQPQDSHIAPGRDETTENRREGYPQRFGTTPALLGDTASEEERMAKLEAIVVAVTYGLMNALLFAIALDSARAVDLPPQASASPIAGVVAVPAA